MSGYNTVGKSQTVVKAKERADKFYKQGYYKAAATDYSIAIDYSDQNDRDLVLLISNRCACYLQLKNYNDALNDAERCVSINPTWIKGFHRLGTCYLLLGDANKALDAFERGLRLEPLNGTLLQGKTECQKQLNQHSNSSSNRSPNYDSNSSSTSSSSEYLSNLKLQLSRFVAKVIGHWMNLANETKMLYGLSLILIGYVLYSNLFSNSYNYYDDYSYSSSYYGTNRGFSTSTLIMIMVAAYFLPPMFPSILGYNYARPFFGMNWSTFLWLVTLISNRSGNSGIYNSFSPNRRRRFY